LHVARTLPVLVSHRMTVLSWLAEASVLPSGLYATEKMNPVCPLRVSCSFPVTTSHSLIGLAWLPEASVLPSRLNAKEYTEGFPLMVTFSLPPPRPKA
jgi:hypothetical protein